MIAVLNSVISVFYYLRVVVNLYMREAEDPIEADRPHFGLMTALVVALLGVLWMGIAPNTAPGDI